MAHVRRLLREALRDIVAAGVGRFAGRVYTGRPWPLNDGERPGAVITMIDAGDGGGEDSQRDNLGRSAGDWRREVRAIVAIYAQGLDVEDQLDDLAADVEAAIDADWLAGANASQLHRLARDLELTATVGAVEDAVSRIGELRLTYRIQYRTAIGTPTSPT